MRAVGLDGGVFHHHIVVGAKKFIMPMMEMTACFSKLDY
jgi:hypothetical protein